ncbi:TonB-dependent receptor plug domain-containing protein, partial [Desulfobacterales bacterium HSG17]|nr:TonB-dependent receptor plug domain-containing protein [Desulfobacterales bacterium HSG17]
MLMFVGENLEVLTIASRREESAWQAPAVAQVITRKTLQEQGSDTLSKALENIPGFYMAPKEWGTQPYLRGIPDSILLLYDTVPLSSDVSKSFLPVDRDLSMAGVKRIEIIKGPGSVLWGPDAYAGILNIVPLTGKDIDGFETGVLYGSPGNQHGAYVNMGTYTNNWDAFLSVSGFQEEMDDTECNIVKFWGNENEPVLPDDRLGSERPDNSQYIEAIGRFAYEDWLTFSGRITDNRKSYAMASDDIAWNEIREAPGGMIKVEAGHSLNHLSAVRFTGSFQKMETTHHIIDQKWKQKENTLYAEGIYDRSFWSGIGLFTGGISYREKHIRNAQIWKSYLPDYLNSANISLFPIPPDEADYNTRLSSIFGQYSHRFGDIESWFGLRYDNHDSYHDRTSFSTGAFWSPSSDWIFKILYGTAYRTPFAKQLHESENPNPENIKSVNLQINWEPSKLWNLNFCGFWNKIEDHVIEDAYAGLSQPNNQEFTGLEIQGRYSPSRTLEFAANMTL